VVVDRIFGRAKQAINNFRKKSARVARGKREPTPENVEKWNSLIFDKVVKKSSRVFNLMIGSAEKRAENKELFLKNFVKALNISSEMHKEEAFLLHQRIAVKFALYKTGIFEFETRKKVHDTFKRTAAYLKEFGENPARNKLKRDLISILGTYRAIKLMSSVDKKMGLLQKDFPFR
jgi:hypothetical protein